MKDIVIIARSNVGLCGSVYSSGWMFVITFDQLAFSNQKECLISKSNHAKRKTVRRKKNHRNACFTEFLIISTVFQCFHGIESL
jgi:hypothetical protein